MRRNRLVIGSWCLVLVGSLGCGDSITDPTLPRVRGTYSSATFWTFSLQGAAPGGASESICAGEIAIDSQNNSSLAGHSAYGGGSGACRGLGPVTVAGSGTIDSGGQLRWIDAFAARVHQEIVQQLDCTPLSVAESYTGSVTGNTLNVTWASTLSCPGGRASFTIAGRGDT